MIFKASNYKNREDLETDIINEFGNTTAKKDSSISGTYKELKKLHLTHNQILWGIIATDLYFGEKEILEKSNRGEIYKSGINLKKKNG